MKAFQKKVRTKYSGQQPFSYPENWFIFTTNHTDNKNSLKLEWPNFQDKLAEPVSDISKKSVLACLVAETNNIQCLNNIHLSKTTASTF